MVVDLGEIDTNFDAPMPWTGTQDYTEAMRDRYKGLWGQLILSAARHTQTIKVHVTGPHRHELAQILVKLGGREGNIITD